MRNLMQVSFKHILISLTYFIGAPNSVRILYNTSLLTSQNLQVTDVLFHFTSTFPHNLMISGSSITSNPHWWFPIFFLPVNLTLRQKYWIKLCMQKVKLSPWALTEHHAMKAYWGNVGITTRILDLGTTW